MVNFKLVRQRKQLEHLMLPPSLNQVERKWNKNKTFLTLCNITEEDAAHFKTTLTHLNTAKPTPQTNTLKKQLLVSTDRYYRPTIKCICMKVDKIYACGNQGLLCMKVSIQSFIAYTQKNWKIMLLDIQFLPLWKLRIEVKK